MGDMRALLRVMVGAALLCACCSDAQKQEEFRLRAGDARTRLELSDGAQVVDGAVVLNATAAGEEDAVALYNGTRSRMLTFVTSFAFSSPAPAILAFVIVPRALQLASFPDRALLQAEHTFAAESELASSGALQFLLRQLPGPPHDLPPTLACNDDSFVTIEYNASALAVAIHSACYSSRPSLLPSIDLSHIISQEADMDVGFIASNGGIFIVSQWNFTSNPPPTAFSLLNSSRSGSQESNPTMSAESADGGTSGDGHSGSAGNSHHGLGKAYVVAFSVLGASILGVIALGVFFLCFRPPMKRPRASHNLGDRPLRDATALGATASSPPLQVMRDTTPLKPIPSPNSSEFAMSVTGSWLKQPIDAR